MVKVPSHLQTGFRCGGWPFTAYLNKDGVKLYSFRRVILETNTSEITYKLINGVPNTDIKIRDTFDELSITDIKTIKNIKVIRVLSYIEAPEDNFIEVK